MRLKETFVSIRVARLSLRAPLCLVLVAGAAINFACGNGEDDTPTNAGPQANVDGGVQSGVPVGGGGVLGSGSDDGGSGITSGGGGGSDAGGGDSGGGTGGDGGGTGMDGGGTDGGGGLDAGPGPNTITKVLVLRAGNATTAAGAAVNATYIDSVAVATGALTNAVDFTTSAFGIAGSGSEGFLTRSADTHSLAVGGYAAAAGAAVTTTTVRAIAFVSAANAVDLTPLVNGAGGAFTGATGAVRSAVSNDGTGFWAAGSGTNDGFWFVPHNAAAQAGTQLIVSGATRDVGIFGGQVYDSADPGMGSVNAVGTNLPTSGTQTAATTLTGGAAFSPYGFIAFDGDGNGSPDVFYVADNAAGVIRYSLSGTTWTAGTAVSLGTGTVGAFAITGVTSGSSVYLYATNYTADLAKATAVYALTDDLRTPALAVAAAPVVSAPTGEVFRGIALAPVP